MEKKPKTKLTELAHQIVCRHIQATDVVVDATAGNGHDTAFLAGLTRSGGRVVAIDIQAAALDSTRRRIEACGFTHVELMKQSHADPISLAPESVTAMMFNLGYLPGGDKTQTTKPESTRRALQQAEGLVKPGGVITVVAYRGHAGGIAEEAIVAVWWNGLSEIAFHKTRTVSDPSDETSPTLYVAIRNPEPAPEVSTHE